MTEQDTKIDLGPGTWIPAEDVPPMTSVANRYYRTADGYVRKFYHHPIWPESDRPVAWFFPATSEQESK